MRSAVHGGTGITPGNEGAGPKQPTKPVSSIMPHSNPHRLLSLAMFPHLLGAAARDMPGCCPCRGSVVIPEETSDANQAELEEFSEYNELNDRRPGQLPYKKRS
jgi:hypothetical protein